MRAWRPAAAKLRKSRLSLFYGQPADAYDRGSDRTAECQHADKLATLLLPAKFMQSPSGTKPAKCWNRARW